MCLTNECLMPRESGKFIAENAVNVFIKKEGIEKLAHEIIENLKNGKLSTKNFSQSSYHPNSNDPRAIDWLFVIDTLNFFFWNPTSTSNKWKVNGESGYFALCAAIKRAIEAGISIIDPVYYSKVTYEELKDIFRPDEGYGEIPLIQERVSNLNEVGQILIDKYNGTFIECVKSCNKSAEQLLKLIVNDFKCFRDEGVYKHQKVSFYKRAQILVGDIWACYMGKDLGTFNDIEYITMFADYRVPQVLIHYSALSYSDELLNKLKNDEHLVPGCDEEIEIRGCSIEVVDRVVKEAKALINSDSSIGLKESDCNSILVDHFLWDYRRKHAEELNYIPFHKVASIYY